MHPLAEFRIWPIAGLRDLIYSDSMLCLCVCILLQVNTSVQDRQEFFWVSDIRLELCSKLYAFPFCTFRVFKIINISLFYNSFYHGSENRPVTLFPPSHSTTVAVATGWSRTLFHSVLQTSSILFLPSVFTLPRQQKGVCTSFCRIPLTALISRLVFSDFDFLINYIIHACLSGCLSKSGRIVSNNKQCPSNYF